MPHAIGRVLLICAVQALAAACSAAGDADPPREEGTAQWRPLVHYTPRRNWMNDPNGLVHYRGRYHLYYQYNPNGNYWGDLSWGHASSADLIHWREHAVAMPATATEDIFSGSIVVDERNSSGLGSAQSPPLVAIYTSAYKAGSGHAEGIQAQSLAYSSDAGETWHAYPHNPVLTLDPESRNFRDPKVSWYAPGNYWLMTAVVADARVVKLYRSRNLIDWEFLSDFGPVGLDRPGMLWEMPDLFALPLDGDAGRQKWVMIVNINPWSIAGGSGAQYFVGSFDGTTFTAEDVAPAGSDPARYRWLDHGADHYAAGTFANQPDGRTIAIAWMGNWDYAGQVPTTPWKGAMTLPRQLGLKTIEGRPQLVSAPVAEYADWVARGTPQRMGTVQVSSAMKDLGPRTRGVAQDIELVIRPLSARRAGLVVRGSSDRTTGTRIFYDTAKRTLTLDRGQSGETNFAKAFSQQHIVDLPLANGELRLRVVVDRSSVEVFAADGRVVITDLVFPRLDEDRVAVFAEQGDAVFSDIAITSLQGLPGPK